MQLPDKPFDSRRTFMKKFGLLGGLAGLGSLPSLASVEYLRGEAPAGSGDLLHIRPGPETTVFAPLDKMQVEVGEAGELLAFDGNNRLLLREEAAGSLELTVTGALGKHLLLLLDRRGRVVDFATFRVEGQTRIEDGSGRFRQLLDVLYHTMTDEWQRECSVLRYNDNYYHVFVYWVRDHVHTLKGMKYFYPELKTGMELYRDSQREDGMIWDNYNKRPPEGDYWEQRFANGDFVRVVDEGRQEFRRIPVENDVEYLYIEGIYYTWKATGDDHWMKGMLDSALKAVEYSVNDPCRWSEKYRLLKRGYTIDTWDFQNDEDADISTGPDQVADPMVITLDHTRFGIMFGDNTGMAASCLFLAEMLGHAGREEEAAGIRQLGMELKDRLDRLAWNGRYYTHHIPEDASVERDLGVDEQSQVSLSNAYSLNRKVSREQADAIIRTYQGLREVMPQGAPGEWYTIFPPFGKGFGGHNTRWSYMNGGVTTIVAGELAHGAFEHGHEAYGADILDRLLVLAGRTGGYLHCTYRGAMEEAPQRVFSPLSLAGVANTDTHGHTVEGVAGWTGEGDNDLHEFPTGRQVFHEIPFDVQDPASNGRKACLGLSGSGPYAREASLEVGQRAASLYVLHATGRSYYAGRIILEYADGTRFVDHIGPGKISNWWYPSAPQDRKQTPRLRVAWRGKNRHSRNVGVCLYGLNNPYPEKEISGIHFRSADDDTKWMVLGLTLSDHPVFFMPDFVSAGIPDNWGAAAVVYALVEGLCGVKDAGTAFDHLELSPRWHAAGEKEARVTIHYPASGGYVSYRYEQKHKQLRLEYTGTQKQSTLRLLLPGGSKPSQVRLNGKDVEHAFEQVGSSAYLRVEGITHIHNELILNF
jgi:hypothetical protein